MSTFVNIWTYWFERSPQSLSDSARDAGLCQSKADHADFYVITTRSPAQDARFYTIEGARRQWHNQVFWRPSVQLVITADATRAVGKIKAAGILERSTILLISTAMLAWFILALIQNHRIDSAGVFVLLVGFVFMVFIPYLVILPWVISTFRDIRILVSFCVSNGGARTAPHPING